MADHQYDHLIAGISNYPDLEKRLAAELRYARPSGSSCGECSKQRVVRKFKAMVETRRKKEPLPRRY